VNLFVFTFYKMENLMTIEGEIKSSLKDEEMITIPLSTYRKLLGKKLVYDIGTKLTRISEDMVHNIIISGHTTDMNGTPIYKIKHIGAYDGSHLNDESRESHTTEFGLSNYTPVTKYYKLVEGE